MYKVLVNFRLWEGPEILVVIALICQCENNVDTIETNECGYVPIKTLFIKLLVSLFYV